MKNVENLIKLIEKKRRDWDERSQFKIKGVGNLSVSDLDSIEHYAKTFLQTGRINNLLTPRGGVGEVLKIYGIEKKEFGW